VPLAKIEVNEKRLSSDNSQCVPFDGLGLISKLCYLHHAFVTFLGPELYAVTILHNRDSGVGASS
jgi:hypothetical protein